METNKGFSAFARGLPMSAKKVRPLADHLRRKKVSDVLALLEVMPHKGAYFLKKVIQSAASNAVYQNKQLDEDQLVVSRLMIDEGQSSTKVWPRARGRADRLKKRTCHITVEVEEKGAK
ncbi:MAG: 50S ribosomal protein L22 [Spirochaetales bacterium]|nr:50S ribosomal protein L22 [Spirochaetales bacterium]